jgi:hypothetical protein
MVCAEVIRSALIACRPTVVHTYSPCLIEDGICSYFANDRSLDFGVREDELLNFVDQLIVTLETSVTYPSLRDKP